MKIIYLASIILFGIYTQTLNAQSPSWQWARSAQGPYLQEEVATACDINNNIYVTGYFTGDSITFGTYSLYNPRSAQASYGVFFIVKYSPDGNVLWARGANPYACGGNDISTDAAGNVYVGGGYGDTITFDSSHTLINPDTSYGASFIVKYDSMGNLQWARTGHYTHKLNYMATDARGYTYLAGNIEGDSVFTYHYTGNPNPGFIARCSPSGNLLWTNILGNQSAIFTLTNLTLDRDNYIYVNGRFSDTAVLGGVTIVPSQGSFFVAKYDTLGTLIWVKQMSLGTSISNMVLDNSKNILLTGTMGAKSIVVGHDSVYNEQYTLFNQTPKIYLLKLDSLAGLKWGKVANVISGASHSKPYGLAADLYDNIYLSGDFGATWISFNGDTLRWNTGEDAFMFSFDTDGNSRCSEDIPAGGDDENSLSADHLGNVYYGGDFTNATVIFGPDSIINTGGENVFVAKYNCPLKTGIQNINTRSRITVYPNPSTSTFYFSGLTSGNTIEIYDMLGQTIHSATTDRDTYPINLSGRMTGVYFYRVTDHGTAIQQGKIVLE